MVMEGHCDCAICHDGDAAGKAWSLIVRVHGQPPVSLIAESGAPRRVPMCGRWYERAEGCRPWHRPPAGQIDVTPAEAADCESIPDSPS